MSDADQESSGELERDKARSVARSGSECPLLEAGRMEWQSSSSKLVVARQEDVPESMDRSWDGGLSMTGSR